MGDLWQVTLDLASPLAYEPGSVTYPMTLDALLTYLVARQQGSTPPDYRSLPKEIEIPITEEKGVYKASSIVLEPPAKTFLVGWTKRNDWWGTAEELSRANLKALKNFRNKRDEKSGVYRAWSEAVVAVSARRAYFWFEGDGGKVRELLLELTNIGAARARGFGMVAGVTVQRVNQDLTWWSPKGYPMRPLPVELGKDRKIPGDVLMAYAAYKPPYWHHASRALCYLPPVQNWLPAENPEEVEKRSKDQARKKAAEEEGGW